MKRRYNYDANTFRLASLVGGSGPNFDNDQNLSYTYDPKGNVRFITDTAALTGGPRVQTYTYDPLAWGAAAPVLMLEREYGD